jgi:hypothetical protein
MKDCKTFLKLQEVVVNKQAEAKKQGYEGNTNSAPTMTQLPNNGASQGQNQPSQGHDNDGGYIPSKGHITADTTSPKVEQRRKEYNPTSEPSSNIASSNHEISTLVRTTHRIQ